MPFPHVLVLVRISVVVAINVAKTATKHLICLDILLDFFVIFLVHCGTTTTYVRTITETSVNSLSE